MNCNDNNNEDNNAVNWLEGIMQRDWLFYCSRETKHGYCLEMESHFSIKPRLQTNKCESNILSGKYETESSPYQPNFKIKHVNHLLHLDGAIRKTILNIIKLNDKFDTMR